MTHMAWNAFITQVSQRCSSQKYFFVLLPPHFQNYCAHSCQLSEGYTVELKRLTLHKTFQSVQSVSFLKGSTNMRRESYIVATRWLTLQSSLCLPEPKCVKSVRCGFILMTHWHTQLICFKARFFLLCDCFLSLPWKDKSVAKYLCKRQFNSWNNAPVLICLSGRADVRTNPKPKHSAFISFRHLLAAVLGLSLAV